MVSERHPKTFRFLKGRMRSALSEAEKDILENLIGDVQQLGHGQVILSRGEMAQQSTILIEGFAARVISRNGSRHIVSLHVPGDFVDLHGYALRRIDHDLVTFGVAKVGYMAHSDLDAILAREPKLSRMLWFASLLDAAIHREWILKLETLSADGCLSHLIAEVLARLQAVGITQQESFAFPFTQAELADACGTTPIHMNRVVRKLREEGILEISRGQVAVLDKARLHETGAFDPAYLYHDL